MHPHPAFRSADGAVIEALIDEVGFGMVFAATPEGLRVAHTPLLSTQDGAIQFHLSRGSALAPHLAGASALIVVNGPDGYVSPRWYGDPDQVPTWNYVAVELEGRVRRMADEGLIDLLEALSERHEARIEDGTAWTMDKLSAANRRRLLAGIVGFELEVGDRRTTFKLSQNKSAKERARVAVGMEAAGQPAIAQLMRALAP